MHEKLKKILTVRRGSHVFGTATPDSDEDFLTVVIPDINHTLGIYRFKGQQVIEKNNDTTYITLHDLVLSGLNGKGELINSLFVHDKHIVDIDDIGRRFMLCKTHLLSQKILKSFMGFANGQLKKTLNGNSSRFRQDLGYDPKSAYHAVRVLYTAYMFKWTGTLSAYIDNDNVRDLCISIKSGKLTRETVIDTINMMIEDVHKIQVSEYIPAEPNHSFWNEFVIDAYCRALSLNT